MDIKDVGFVFSEHYHKDNANREAAIKSIGGDGTKIVAKFYWDKQHGEGAEWHWITDNGIIIITNVSKHDGKYVCTKLIARPAQLNRYRSMGFKNELNESTAKMNNWIMPQFIINKAIQHQKKGLNHT